MIFSKRRNRELHALLMQGREQGEHVDLSTNFDGVVLKVKLGEEVLTECTVNDSLFLFLALSHFLGKDLAKGLVNMQPDGKWELKE